MQEMNTTSEKIMKLPSEIKHIIAMNTESRKKTDASFNIFQICKVDHYETIHSAIIAEFVTPAFWANYYKKPDVFAGECATYITDYFGKTKPCRKQYCENGENNVQQG